MEYLDLQKLKHCCRPNASEMDDIETEIVQNILLKFFIINIDMCSISNALYKGGYITSQVMKNIDRVIQKDVCNSELKAAKRIIVYLTNKIPFVALLWAMVTSGHQRIANLLLSCLEMARLSLVCKPPKKATVFQSKAIYQMVIQLKYISDSKTFDNPVVFIRRLAMRFKDKFDIETNAKRKMADKYFAILAVELDNCTFMSNKFVSTKSLIAELKRVLPFTSNPAMNEALINGRVAEIKALMGEVNEAVSMVQDLVSVTCITEASPEAGNIFYMQLNVLLQHYENNPTPDMKRHFIEIGYHGLQFIRTLDKEIMTHWNLFYTIRIIFCAVGLGICGRPLCTETDKEMLQTAQYFLSEIQDVVNAYGIRKMMSFKLAMGRLLHLQGEKTKAVEYLTEARTLALRGNFVELKHIDEYKRRITSGGK